MPTNLKQLFETAKPLLNMYIPNMSNWLMLNYKLKGLQSLDIVQSMLVYELSHKAREHIVDRLLMRYSILKQKELRCEIREYIKAVQTKNRIRERY